MGFEYRRTCIASDYHRVPDCRKAHYGMTELKEATEVGCGDRKAARNMIVFLLTELDLASAYVAIAQPDPEGKQDRNRKNAREVYETMLHFLAEAALPQDEETDIRNKLATLKSGLQSLGDIF
jgi:hypothetical protein